MIGTADRTCCTEFDGAAGDEDGCWKYQLPHTASTTAQDPAGGRHETPTPTGRVAIHIHGHGLLTIICLSRRQIDRAIYTNATKRTTAAYYVFHEKDVYIYDHKRIFCEYLFILFIIYLPFIIYHLSIYPSHLFSRGIRGRAGGGRRRLYGGWRRRKVVWMEGSVHGVRD